MKACRLSGICRDLGIYGGSCEQVIAMQIQENTLEQMLEVEDTVTSPLENFDFVVKAFHKAAVLAENEKVSDLIPPSVEQFQKRIKAPQLTCLNLFLPAPDFSLSLFLRQVHLEDRCQAFSKIICLFCEAECSKNRRNTFRSSLFRSLAFLRNAWKLPLSFWYASFESSFFKRCSSCFRT